MRGAWRQAGDPSTSPDVSRVRVTRTSGRGFGNSPNRTLVMPGAFARRYAGCIACALLLMLVATSCGSDASVGPAWLFRTYRLAAVDGQPVPFYSPSQCYLGCYVESGSLTVIPGDTAYVEERVSGPPSGSTP